MGAQTGLDLLQSIRTVAGFTYNHDVVLHFQEGAQTLTDQLVIVGQKDSDGAHEDGSFGLCRRYKKQILTRALDGNPEAVELAYAKGWKFHRYL